MIISFSVENFGSIKERQTLSFEADKSDRLEDQYIIYNKHDIRLLKLGLIYGKNASGKTTILKALDFLRDLVLKPEEKKTDTLKFSPFLFDDKTPGLTSKFSIDFIQNDIRYLYNVEFDKKAILKEELDYYIPSKKNIFKRDTDTEQQFTSIKFRDKSSVDKAFRRTLESNTLWNNTVLGGFLKTNIEFNELKEVTDWFRKFLRAIVLSDTSLSNYVTSRIDSEEIDRKDIVRILKKADFNISDVIIKKEEEDIPKRLIEFLEKNSTIPSDEVDKIRSKGKVTSVNLEFEHNVNSAKYRLPFQAESQGTQRYYEFAGLLALLIRNSIAFPIDELEASLHPDLFTHFLLSFLTNSKSSQIIATTHFRELLNNRDIFRNDAIWFTDKNENGATELYSLNDFDTTVVRDTTNVYNAYKAGKLGGVPNLGDYYIDLENEK